MAKTVERRRGVHFCAFRSQNFTFKKFLSILLSAFLFSIASLNQSTLADDFQIGLSQRGCGFLKNSKIAMEIQNEMHKCTKKKNLEDIDRQKACMKKVLDEYAARGKGHFDRGLSRLVHFPYRAVITNECEKEMKKEVSWNHFHWGKCYLKFAKQLTEDSRDVKTYLSSGLTEKYCTKRVDNLSSNLSDEQFSAKAAKINAECKPGGKLYEKMEKEYGKRFKKLLKVRKRKKDSMYLYFQDYADAYCNKNLDLACGRAAAAQLYADVNDARNGFLLNNNYNCYNLIGEHYCAKELGLVDKFPIPKDQMEKSCTFELGLWPTKDKDGFGKYVRRYVTIEPSKLLEQKKFIIPYKAKSTAPEKLKCKDGSAPWSHKGKVCPEDRNNKEEPYTPPNVGTTPTQPIDKPKDPPKDPNTGGGTSVDVTRDKKDKKKGKGKGDGKGSGTGSKKGKKGGKGKSEDGSNKGSRREGSGSGRDPLWQCHFLDFSDNPHGGILNGSDKLPVKPKCIYQYTAGRPEFIFADSLEKDLSAFNVYTYMDTLRKTYAARLIVAKRFLTGKQTDSSKVKKMCGIDDKDLESYLNTVEKKAKKKIEDEGLKPAAKNLMDDKDARIAAWVTAKGLQDYTKAASSLYYARIGLVANGVYNPSCSFFTDCYTTGTCNASTEDKLKIANGGVISAAKQAWNKYVTKDKNYSGQIKIIANDSDDLLKQSTEFVRKHGRQPTAKEVCAPYTAISDAIKTAKKVTFDAIEGNPYLLAGHDPEAEIFNDLPAIDDIANAANSVEEAGDLKNAKFNKAVNKQIDRIAKKMDDDLKVYCDPDGKSSRDSWYDKGNANWRRLMNHQGLKDYYLSMYLAPGYPKLVGCAKNQKAIDPVGGKCPDGYRKLYKYNKEYENMRKTHECIADQVNRDNSPTSVFAMAGCVIGMFVPGAQGGVIAGCAAYFTGSAALDVVKADKKLDEKFDCYTYMSELCSREEYIAAKEALEGAYTALGITVAVELVGAGFLLRTMKGPISKINKLIPKMKQANAAVEAAEIELKVARESGKREAIKAAEKKLAAAKAGRLKVEKSLEKLLTKVEKMHAKHDRAVKTLASTYAPEHLVDDAVKYGKTRKQQTKKKQSAKAAEKQARKKAAQKEAAKRRQAKPRDIGDVLDPKRAAKNDLSPITDAAKPGEALKRARARKAVMENHIPPKGLEKQRDAAVKALNVARDKYAIADDLLEDYTFAQAKATKAKGVYDDLVKSNAPADEIAKAKKAYEEAQKNADGIRKHYQKASKDATKAGKKADKAVNKYAKKRDKAIKKRNLTQKDIDEEIARQRAARKKAKDAKKDAADKESTKYWFWENSKKVEQYFDPKQLGNSPFNPWKGQGLKQAGSKRFAVKGPDDVVVYVDEFGRPLKKVGNKWVVNVDEAKKIAKHMESPAVRKKAVKPPPSKKKPKDSGGKKRASTDGVIDANAYGKSATAKSSRKKAVDDMHPNPKTNAEKTAKAEDAAAIESHGANWTKQDHKDLATFANETRKAKEKADRLTKVAKRTGKKSDKTAAARARAEAKARQKMWDDYMDDLRKPCKR